VTVRQFRQFVQLSGYKWNRWQAGDGEDHPIRYVSWSDAIAFCEWLNRRLRGLKPSGFELTLPGEAEWTKAARGGLRIPRQPVIQQGRLGSEWPQIAWINNPLSRRDHPWGNEPTTGRANTNGYANTTTLVNQFSAGQSPYGVMDMAGNVWEWTRSSWQENYQLENDGAIDTEAWHTLRGTAWYTTGERPRCGVRLRYIPYSRPDYGGYRIVLSPLSDR
ncbi:MAG: SUMF1/EgtB/PvdO family nonheme iron enzyme, partial [Anaerolineales bacterium]|nr:SUMF1/EgtB/PvdO family nonheme iron enzyme [Anaerolineales bacterium]